MFSYIKKNKVIAILIAIICIAFFFRIWDIRTNPPGVHADEADSGYNAYSILKTGRDFYGNFLPMQIRGFGENYRTPISTYLTIPSVWILGLNTFAIRLPAVIFGTFFVALIYLLTRKLFDSVTVGLIAAFITAVNPWAVHISRAYADHVLALDFVLIGLLLLLKKNKTLVSFAAGGFFLGLSLFSYHAPKIFLLLFLPVFFLFYKNDLLKKKLFLSFAIAVLFVFYIAVFALSIFNNGAKEFDVVSILDSSKASKSVDRERRVTLAPLKISGIFHNKIYYYAVEFTRNASKSLSFNYLYLDGDNNLTAGVGDRGLFYPIEFPFLLFGIYFLIRKKQKLGIFLLIWGFISIVPGAVTTNGMYTYRNIFLLPVLISATAFGVFEAYQKIRKKKLFIFLKLLFIVLFGVSIIAYFFHYFYDYPVYAGSWWAAPQKDVITYIEQHKNKYNEVFVDGGRDWPLLYAFYEKINPGDFQDIIKKSLEKKTEEYVIIDKIKFGNLQIMKDDILQKRFPSNSLIVTGSSAFPQSKPLESILSKDDWGTIYKIFETK